MKQVALKFMGLMTLSLVLTIACGGGEVLPRTEAVAPAGPPNKFFGTVTIDGAPAPDGTEVTIWVGGKEGPAARVIVSGGRYDINVIQPGGVSYANKKVTFKVGAAAAEQTATWEMGGVEALDLVVGEGTQSTDVDHPPGTFEPQDRPAGLIEIATEGNNLKFDHASLSAKAGTEVTVRFHNSASALQHNWVLVQAGTKDDVATAGTAAGANNSWIPQGDSRIIARMNLVDGGATGEVNFKAPPAGTYQFVCTVPGHNLLMFGDFEVMP